MADRNRVRKTSDKGICNVNKYNVPTQLFIIVMTSEIIAIV